MKIELNEGDVLEVVVHPKSIIKELIIDPRTDQEKIFYKEEGGFKDGDVLILIRGDHREYPFIYKGLNNDKSYQFYVGIDSMNNIIMGRDGKGWGRSKLDYATKAEKLDFFNKLKSKGLRWNPDTKKVERYVPEFKNGDILHSKHYHEFAIFKEYIDDERWPLFRSYYNTDGRSNDDLSVGYFRLATDDEVRELYRELGSKGLSWNPIKNELMRIRRRVPTGHKYLYITSSGMVVETIEGHTSIDDLNFKTGNYFLLEDRDKAEKASEEIIAIYSRQLKP